MKLLVINNSDIGKYVFLTKEEAEQALTCRDFRQDEKEGAK